MKIPYDRGPGARLTAALDITRPDFGRMPCIDTTPTSGWAWLTWAAAQDNGEMTPALLATDDIPSTSTYAVGTAARSTERAAAIAHPVNVEDPARQRDRPPHVRIGSANRLFGAAIQAVAIQPPAPGPSPWRF